MVWPDPGNCPRQQTPLSCEERCHFIQLEPCQPYFVYSLVHEQNGHK